MIYIDEFLIWVASHFEVKIDMVNESNPKITTPKYFKKSKFYKDIFNQNFLKLWFIIFNSKFKDGIWL